MKRAAIASAILGLLAMRAEAQWGQQPVPQYNGNQVTQVCTPWGAVIGGQRQTMMGQPMVAPGQSCATCGSYGGCNSCGAGGFRGDRSQKLLDFLFYQPTIPCDWRPRPTEYVPPLTAWFPNGCESVGGDCGSVCRRFALVPPRAGCANCAASLGALMVVGRTDPRSMMSLRPMATVQPIGAVLPCPQYGLSGQSGVSQTQPGVYTTVARPPFSYYATSPASPNLLPLSLQQQATSASPYAPSYQGLPQRP
jgi:hypothetical protein